MQYWVLGPSFGCNCSCVCIILMAWWLYFISCVIYLLCYNLQVVVSTDIIVSLVSVNSGYRAEIQFNGLCCEKFTRCLQGGDILYGNLLNG